MSPRKGDGTQGVETYTYYASQPASSVTATQSRTHTGRPERHSGSPA